jgi:putative SOS response-associated peptidase YedK
MSFFTNIRLVSDFLPDVQPLLFDFEPTFHKVAQSFCNWPVALHDGEGISIKLFEWGLIGDYMNTPEKIKEARNSMANARSEKILEDKNSYWYRIRKNRCIAFTTGFFEHRDIGAKRKVPYFIRLKGLDLFPIAGLYNYSPVPDPETGEMKGTFTIVTRTANSLLTIIHNGGMNAGRMPLILTKEMAMEWLEPALSDDRMKTILSYELPSQEMEAWPVRSVRSRKEDTGLVIEQMAYDGLEDIVIN